MEWYTFLKDFQSAITGVVGFGGVILTLRFNKKLAKSEREAIEFTRDGTLIRAVAAELRSFEKALDQFPASPEPENGFLVPRMERTLTKDLMKEIAGLKHAAVDDIIHVLLSLDEIDRNMLLFSQAMPNGYFQVEPDKVSLTRAMHLSVLEQIKALLPKLEGTDWHSAKA